MGCRPLLWLAYIGHIACMLYDQLTRIPEFSHVASNELRALAAGARILCLPKNRWLVQNGKHLHAYFYLLRGSVRTYLPDQRLKHPSFGALHHFYPGCHSVKTVSTCQVLFIEASRREFLMQQGGDMQKIGQQREAWLADFLDSQMMRDLSSDHWRALLKSFRKRTFEQGASIITKGEKATACYVLERGHAAVHDQGRTLRHLNPGDFFGEDALILGTQRNASVTALEDVVLHAIEAPAFERWLLRAVVEPVSACASGVALNLGKSMIPGSIPIGLGSLRDQLDQLDMRSDYYIVGGSQRHRELAAFLLLQRGIRVRLVAS